MTTPRPASGVRRRRENKTPAGEHFNEVPYGMPYGVPVPEALHEAIEAERGNLSKADSLLGCLVTSMEHEAGAADAPYYPDVAQLARELVRQSINRLDSLALQRLVLRNRVKDGFRLPRFGEGYRAFDCDMAPIVGHA